MKKVIVTGANGYLGQQLIVQLIEHGYFVYALIRSNKKPIDHENINYIQYDLSKEIVDIEHFISPSIDGIFHFAWDGAYGEKREDYLTQIKNIKQDYHVVEMAKKVNCKRIIYAASIFEYEMMNELSQHLPGTSSMYALSKFYAHAMIKKLAKQERIDFVSGIISNTYGGDIDSPRFIHYCIRQMAQQKEGDFSSGLQAYDVIHIKDAANMFIQLFEKGISSNEYYIGNGEVKTLKEYIEKIQMIVNPEFKINFGVVKETGHRIDYSLFDLKQIEIELGYKYQISFDEGIRDLLSQIEVQNED
ncbi:MAG: NAD(P)-dependent oxidoreductase [Erysipelotrichaceae bacterium]